MLAVVDTLYLLTCFFIQPLKVIREDTNWFPELRNALPYIEPYMWAFASITQTITVWMVLLVTTDRYIAICHPLNSSLRNISRCKVAVVVTIVAAVIYNIPRFLERKIVMMPSCTTGEVVVTSEKTSLMDNKLYYLLYKFIGYLIFRSLGPLVVLVYLNVNLIIALSTVRRRARTMSRRHRNRENITLMLVVVVTVFIICEIPGLIVRILFTGSWKYAWFSMELTNLRYANSVTNALLTINSSINFIIYCLIGKKFRKIFYNMICIGNGAALIEVSETEPLTMKSAVNKGNTMEAKSKTSAAVDGVITADNNVQL